jgi:LmbE family N-acetylglucosaminyl deacetylase
VGSGALGFLVSVHRRLLSHVIFRLAIFAGRRATTSDKAAIVFAPHQDDETFGCGGLIAQKAALHAPLRVVFLTDGGATLGDVDADTRERLVSDRRREVLEATATLGLQPDQLEFLDYPDGRLCGLSEREQAALQSRIEAILRQFRPEEAFVPHRNDRHPDHEATQRIVSAAVARSGLNVTMFEYAIWLVWWWNRGRMRLGDFANPQVLAIGDVIGRKQRAMSAFRSQQAALPPGFLDRFNWPFEIFFRAPDVVSP